MNDEHFEIERKFIIRRPDPAYLETNGVPSEILQTYLISSPGESSRVRKRWHGDEVRYYYTSKTRVNAMRQIEREWELTETEYEAFLESADPECRPVRKQRWVVEYRGQRFEIDLYPFWKKQAWITNIPRKISLTTRFRFLTKVFLFITIHTATKPTSPIMAPLAPTDTQISPLRISYAMDIMLPQSPDNIYRKK